MLQRAARCVSKAGTSPLSKLAPEGGGEASAWVARGWGSGRLYCVMLRRRPAGSTTWEWRLMISSRKSGMLEEGPALFPLLQQVLRFSSGPTGPGQAEAGEGKAKGDPASAGGSVEDEGGAEKQKKEGDEEEEEEEPDPEDYQPEEKIGFLRGLMYLTITGIALGSLYFIGKELLPSRMSPNYLFNDAFEAVKKNHEIINRFGEPLKGYGRDAGGRREGRRNFVEHKKYKGEDGVERLRIRFNIEGPFGHAFVFAEVTSEMSSGEWSYLLVQDLQTGRVYTLQDNRAMIDAMHRAKSPEEKEALARLIKGGQ